MKIGVLIDRLNVGGVEKIAIEEVRALIDQGQDAHLVVMREKAVVENAFPDLLEGIPIEYLDKRLNPLFKISFGFPLFHFFSSFHLSYPLLLPFVVKKNEYDYLIVHGTYTTLTAIALKKRRGISFSAFIWDPVSYIMQRVYSTTMPKMAYKLFNTLSLRFDHYIINNMSSGLVGGPAHNNFIRSQRKDIDITTIYPSVNPSSHIPSKQSYVLVVTAWKEGKHPEYLVDIVKAMPTIKIKMAGKWIDQNYKLRFEKLIKDEKCDSNIEVLGGVSEQELSMLYGNARLLLQTNDDRGFGMPALEAAAQGTTFIIPEGQGVCELFEDGVDGFYTKERDTATIISHLSRLLEDDSLAAQMGKSAWKKVGSNYSWNFHASALINTAKKHSGQ
jgi:glycosyltransferase involved in cell wall biosynthesis